MSIIRKMFVICDKCGARREIPFDQGDPFSPASGSEIYREWFSPDRIHHLCPDCAAVYKARKEEMDRELKKLAGIETIEVDI